MNVQIGDTIRFIGYGEEVPAEEQLLEVGAELEVVEINQKEKSVSVRIDNPDFNPKKKESDANPRTILNDVFEEEFEVVEAAGDDEVEEEKPARSRGKAAPAKEETKAPTKAAKAAPKAAAKEEAKPAKGKAAAPAKGKLPAKSEDKAEENADPYADLDEDQEDQDILALVNEKGVDILDLAQEIAEENAATEYKLGGVLFHVRKSGAYKKLDKAYNDNGGFGLYVADQLNVEYRKAMYLIDIYYKWNKFGLSPEKVAQIGWSKAAKIAAVMTDDNADELVTLAENSSVSELSENIKTNYKEVGGTKGEKKVMKLFKFKLFEDQAKGVEDVLNGLAAAMGFKRLDDAFEHIVMEWATEHPLKKAAQIPTSTTKAPVAAGKKQVPARAAR